MQNTSLITRKTKEDTILSMEDLSVALPAKTKKHATPALLKAINELNEKYDPNDPHDKETIISIQRCIPQWASALDSLSNVSPEDFVEACTFVAFLNNSGNATEAYKQTFPDKVKMFIERDTVKHIPQYAKSYMRKNIVKAVLKADEELSSIGLKVLSIKALDNLARFLDSYDEKIRYNASVEVLRMCNRDSTLNVNMEVNHKNNPVINEINSLFDKIASTQKELMKEGMTVRQLNHIKQNQQYIDAKVELNAK